MNYYINHSKVVYSTGGEAKVMMGGSTLGSENSKLWTLAHKVAVEIVLRMCDEFNHPPILLAWPPIKAGMWLARVNYV